jgi:hypothetical protein
MSPTRWPGPAANFAESPLNACANSAAAKKNSSARRVPLSAIFEKFHMEENGEPVEMTTLYFLDGDQLKMTHYCMAGNQPTMRGSYSPETKTLAFELLSITNLKSPDDGHMHHATYTFIDNDHFKTSWTFRKQQKDAFTEEVTYVRVK